MSIKSLIKSLVPPILIGQIKSILDNNRNGWSGNFESWEHAKKCCTGYESDLISNKVKEATLMIKKGEAKYERDSVTFDKIEYSFPLLSSLLYISLKNNFSLNIIDFGGALGSSFYQNYKFLSEIRNLKWNIIEQKNFVEVGKEFFEDNRLKFFHTIDDCLSSYEINEKPNAILLSGVLQYLDEPYIFLDMLFLKNIKYLIFDRTAFISKGPDRLTIQKIPSLIYKASYPAWFFDESKFLNTLRKKYELIYDFTSYVREEELMYIENKPLGMGKGFFFKLKENV